MTALAGAVESPILRSESARSGSGDRVALDQDAIDEVIDRDAGFVVLTTT